MTERPPLSNTLALTEPVLSFVVRDPMINIIDQLMAVVGHGTTFGRCVLGISQRFCVCASGNGVVSFGVI